MLNRIDLTDVLIFIGILFVGVGAGVRFGIGEGLISSGALFFIGGCVSMKIRG